MATLVAGMPGVVEVAVVALEEWIPLACTRCISRLMCGLCVCVLCAYLYKRVYVCENIHTYIYICIYIYVYIHVDIYTYIHIYTYLHVYMCICVYICIYI